MTVLSEIRAAWRALSRVEKAVFLLAVAWLAGWEARYAANTYDDVYICLRYARNFAAGAGWVFNPGERVEGVTSPAWVLLLAALGRAGIDPLPVAKALGGLLVLAIPGLLLALSARLKPFNPAVKPDDGFDERRAPLAAVIPAVLTAGSAPLAFWAVNGLETGAYVFLVTLGILLAAREFAGGESRLPAGSAVFLLVALTRPEGAMFAGLYLAFLARYRGARRALAGVAVIGGGLAVLLAARWAYFGLLVPNTYFAKAGDGLWSMGPGYTYLAEFLAEQGGWFLLVGAALAFLAGGAGGKAVSGFAERRTAPAASKARRPSNPSSDLTQAPLAMFAPGVGPIDARTVPLVMWLCAAFVAAQAGFVCLVSRDWMFGWRFVVPVLPALFLPAGAGFALAWKTLSASWVPPARAKAGLVVVAGFVAFSAVRTVKLDASARSYTAGMRAAHLDLGRWLGRSVPPGTRLALADCGLVPYLSGLPTIDLLGLTDAFIARHGPQEGAGYVLDLGPELIVLAQRDELAGPGTVIKRVIFLVDRAIGSDPRFSAGWAHYQAWRHGDDYDLHLYMRKDFFARWVRGG